MTEISKTDLRRSARARRAELVKAVPDFAHRLASHAGSLKIPPNSLIGAYAALPGEADPRLLLEELARTGSTFAFPRVAASGAALVFHHVRQTSAMRTGTYGISEPSPDWPVAQPKILLVPLLAFDSTGHRLGYGGGFYDRTLAALRSAGLRAIGVAYAGQEVSDLPFDSHDQRLDAVLTERGLIRFES